MNTGVLLVLRKTEFCFGAIANILGIIYNALFNFIYGISTNGSLGIAIILFTIIVNLGIVSFDDLNNNVHHLNCNNYSRNE